MSKYDISIVVPVYNEEPVIELFYQAVERVIHDNMGERKTPLSLEYLFVDDGSTDGTLLVLKELSGVNEHIHYLSFSKNFVKEAAIYAGLTYAKGKYTVVMDVDL